MRRTECLTLASRWRIPCGRHGRRRGGRFSLARSDIVLLMLISQHFCHGHCAVKSASQRAKRPFLIRPVFEVGCSKEQMQVDSGFSGPCSPSSTIGSGQCFVPSGQEAPNVERVETGRNVRRTIRSPPVALMVPVENPQIDFEIGTFAAWAIFEVAMICSSLSRRASFCQTFAPDSTQDRPRTKGARRRGVSKSLDDRVITI
jgi:hypothetical protein